MQLDKSAVEKLKDLLIEEQNPALKLRVFVEGGGCSGMQYGFTFDEDQSEDDFNFTFDTVTVLVDSMSMEYLRGANIRYSNDVMGSSFVIDNPQAATTCGCGSSFSPT
jgi:iron-sulfur cluster insertion protein